MPVIHITTFVATPHTRVFDLSRNTRLYKQAFSEQKETFHAAGSGNMLEQGETLTIHSKRLSKLRSLTLRVTEFEQGVSFVEEQVKGDLLSYRHQHHFKPVENGTVMIDLVEYDYPRDFLGKLLGKIYMKAIVEQLVSARVSLVKQYAESEKWKVVLS